MRAADTSATQPKIDTKKQLTWMATRYTFRSAIQKGQIAQCDFARPSVTSRIILEFRLIP